jgi:hypothetical protein
MYNSTRDLLDAFKATPETLAALLAGVSQKRARSAKGGDEGWSVVEVLCHLRDAAEIGLQRDRLMAEQDNPEIAPYDQEQLAAERNYAAQDLGKALAEFTHLRREHIAFLEGLPPEAWRRPANHLEIGNIDILNHVLHMVCHDAIHCAQIARQLKVGG